LVEHVLIAIAVERRDECSLQFPPVVLESSDQRLGCRPVADVEAADFGADLVEQDVDVACVVAGLADAAHALGDLSRPVGVDVVARDGEERTHSARRHTYLMQALRIGRDSRADVVPKQRAVLLRDEIFNASDVGIGTASRNLDKLVFTDHRAKQTLDLHRHPSSLVAQNDLLAPRGSEPPGR
jgi:hypothetical protein